MKKLAMFICAVVVAAVILVLIITFSFKDSNPQSMTSTEPQANLVEDTTIYTAHIKTSMGDITAELYPDLVPETVTNFITLAEEGKYDGVPFHRVISEFMIQTGDFENQDGTGGHSYKGPGTVIPDEFHDSLSHTQGALSMANRGPNTGGSQFFIVHAESTGWLDGGHSVFGHVVEGFDVVDEIANVDVDMNDNPLEPVLIESIQIEK